MAFTGFLRHGVVRLLAVLLVILNLHSGAPLSLSVDKPQSSSGDVVIVDSASNSLIAIVTCNTERQQNVNVVGNGSLYLQLVPNGNKPNVFFVLPNKTGTARLPEGNSSINISCGKLTAAVAVSIVGPTFAADVNQPYFTASPRFVRISADTLPGTVIANYKAEFPGSEDRETGTRQYVVHDAFLSTPFYLNSSSGELIVHQSLQKDGILPMYDVVVVADQGHSEAWTLTTIIIDYVPRIENFQEVTTANESSRNVVAFSFDLFTGNLNISIADGDRFQLQWETVDHRSSGLITLNITVTKQTNHTTSGPVTYRFTVYAASLGEGPLILTLFMKLQCLRYDYDSCNQYFRSWCTCLQWQYDGESETIQISAKKGDFKVVNFRDVTAESTFENNTAIFEFEFDPMTNLNTSHSYVLRLTWSQVSGPRSGVIEAANCRYYKRFNAQLETDIHTGTYRLYVPLHLLTEGRLLVNLTINVFCISYPYSRFGYSRNQCSCTKWQIRGTSDSLEISDKQGPVSIVNLRDITTQSDLTDENAVFAFDIHPKVSPIVALGYSVKIQWSQLRVEFGSSHRARTIYLPPEGARSCGGTPDSTLELIGAGSYKLTVPTVVFDSGPLSISVSVSLACLQFTSNYCPHCSQWRYTSRASSNIAIPAKRGSLAPFEVDLKMWPKEQCFEAADAIKASDVSSILIEAIRDNADDIGNTSYLHVYGERFLCERKGYVSFRGVLVKLYDFLATKSRDALGDWLKGGARHIVVAERQISIKEGACGIALTSLEDPACNNGGKKKGK